jgi:flagellar L-ring protein FlgH
MTRLRGVLLLGAGLAIGAGPLRAQEAGPAVRQSWTADRRDYAVGEVLTVLIDEYTLAAANQGNFASDRRARDLSAGAAQNVVSGVPRVGADVSTRNDAESRQRGEATRQNRFQGEMTVRVTELGPGGVMRVEGRKVVNIDRNQEELLLRGWVRPQDVSTRNTVDSWRVADAELTYTASGKVGRPRGGLLGRLLGWIWP